MRTEPSAEKNLKISKNKQKKTSAVDKPVWLREELLCDQHNARQLYRLSYCSEVYL